MNFTSMLLGGSWGRGEWPDYIEVAHDVNCIDMRSYVPDRTCRMHRDEHGTWHCGNCDDSYRNGEGIVPWYDSWEPDFCPDCGARVIADA